jgi:putative DNA primase/helicase
LKLVHFKSRVAEEGEEPTAEHPVRDKALLDTLLADEGSGILALLIEWAGRYAAEGLRSCPAVEAEVRDYRTEVDVLGQFITDQLVPGEGYEYDNTTLYAAYKLWALEMGLHNIWPQSHLTRALKERGFVQRRRNEARYWEGIGPRSTRTE